jgi:hypothetical protein
LQTNWFDLAGTALPDFEPDLLNALGSINANHIRTIDKEPLEAYVCEQLDIPFTWDIYWTEAAREGRRLDINDIMFGQHCTMC